MKRMAPHPMHTCKTCVVEIGGKASCHGTTDPHTPSGVILARWCPSLLNTNQSMDLILKFKTAKWCSRTGCKDSCATDAFAGFIWPGAKTLR